MTQGLERETIFGREFQSAIAKVDDGTERAAREKAYNSFVAKGVPTPADEEWKYTSLASLGISELGIRVADLQVAAPAGVSVRTNDAARLTSFSFERNGLTALNAAFANVVTITIPKETSIDEPILVTFRGVEKTVAMPHFVVFAEAGSKATIVERYESEGALFTNAAVQVFVADNANLTHYRVQKESTTAVHVGTTEIELGRASHYNSTNINLGARIARHDIALKFTAEGSEAFVDGLYMLAGDQHSDTHSSIDHAVPNCVSHQSYKGVLNDKSRGVFNGKVFVRENARGTDAQQSNKNLLLSNDARVDTKPQLEIFNDDVKCAHGATVGQLEDEELFYLLSRGIGEQLARNLLTYGFAEEIVNKIEIESIKEELDAAVLNRLDTRLE